MSSVEVLLEGLLMHFEREDSLLNCSPWDLFLAFAIIHPKWHKHVVAVVVVVVVAAAGGGGGGGASGAITI